MVGLGEACSLVAAVLFTAEANTLVFHPYYYHVVDFRSLFSLFPAYTHQVKHVDFKTLSLEIKLTSCRLDESHKESSISELQPTFVSD